LLTNSLINYLRQVWTK